MVKPYCHVCETCVSYDVRGKHWACANCGNIFPISKTPGMSAAIKMKFLTELARRRESEELGYKVEQLPCAPVESDRRFEAMEAARKSVDSAADFMFDLLMMMAAGVCFGLAAAKISVLLGW